MKSGRKLKFTQNKPYGCALYAVANIFDDLENLVTDERIEFSKNGLITGHVSKWMQEDGYNWSIDVWYYDHRGGKIPNEFFSYVPDKSDGLPVLFSVSNDGGLNHIIGGIITPDGQIEIFDSLKAESVIIPFHNVNKLYDNVHGFYCFIDNDNSQYYIQLFNKGSENEKYRIS